MGNMSYCRFENTYRDLLDCFENMDDDDLSASETKFRKALVEVCMNIADQYREFVEE